jgi:hypothetical protein
MTRFIADAPGSGRTPRLDFVGTVLFRLRAGRDCLGRAAVEHLGLGQAEVSPVERFGLSLTMFVIALGGILLWAFVQWQHHREDSGSDALVHLDLLIVPTLRAGLIGLFT